MGRLDNGHGGPCPPSTPARFANAIRSFANFFALPKEKHPAIGVAPSRLQMGELLAVEMCSGESSSATYIVGVAHSSGGRLLPPVLPARSI